MMKEKYSIRLAEVEKYLQRVLPEKVNNEWKKAVIGDTRVPDFFLDRINKPALDLLSRGGKRWRPVLMMLFYQLYREDNDILALTPLVELPHNGTLIVDDIEDSSDFRRGAPAVHLIYGTDMAVNTANFLYFLPHILIDSSSFSDDIKLKAYRCYSECMSRLHIGQGLDIQWHNDKGYIPSEKEYMAMCSFKTGGLSHLSGELGSLAGGASDSVAASMGKACEAMGVGFQILDDVTNLVTGNPGKKRGDDIVEGKKSLPVILFASLGGDTARLEKIFEYAAANGIEKSGDAIEEAISMLDSSGAVAMARRKAFAILEKSKYDILSGCRACEAAELIGYIFDTFLKQAGGGQK